ncbi:hypothetical protein VB711_17485 [Cronbergia sp. UHCC 0137]|uniref:PFE-CTERM domain-containing protein n=1 Tax=Cronbergia sp. UHCC 0137 TaxID=3110239 RepID=UPI002B211827|nr:hypothetical protein [Cronbergia sp. UHCC 0137]MEA5619620.1 hypothetical protein [Cronbergia sp. UHCC 0137]
MLKVNISTPPIIAKALAVTGFTASLLFAATPANALSFTFSFQDIDSVFGPATNGFITGTLDGLVEGNNPGAGITAEVLSSPGGQGLGAYSFSNSLGGNAFVVTGGNITFANAAFLQGSNELRLGTPSNGGYGNRLSDSSFSFFYADISNATTFTPATPVPFEFNPTLGLATLGIWFGVSKLRKKYSLNH